MSKQNLSKFRLDEQIKKSYLKNLGDVSLVLKELNLPQDYILSRIEKIKKTETSGERDSVAESIMGYISVGYRARRIRILEMINSLEGVEQCNVSLCCSAPVQYHSSSEEEWYSCLQCLKRCQVRTASYMDVYRIKKELIEELREEDKHLINFAKEMGYTKQQTPGILVQQKKNIIMMPGTLKENELKDLEKLSPMDRERLIDRLTKEIVSIEKSEDTSESTG